METSTKKAILYDSSFMETVNRYTSMDTHVAVFISIAAWIFILKLLNFNNGCVLICGILASMIVLTYSNIVPIPVEVESKLEFYNDRIILRRGKRPLRDDEERYEIYEIKFTDIIKSVLSAKNRKIKIITIRGSIRESIQTYNSEGHLVSNYRKTLKKLRIRFDPKNDANSLVVSDIAAYSPVKLELR